MSDNPSNAVLAVKIEAQAAEIAELKKEIGDMKTRERANMRTGFGFLISLVTALGGFILYLLRHKLGV